jgi:hypothetical protein
MAGLISPPPSTSTSTRSHPSKALPEFWPVAIIRASVLDRVLPPTGTEYALAVRAVLAIFVLAQNLTAPAVRSFS